MSIVDHLGLSYIYIFYLKHSNSDVVSFNPTSFGIDVGCSPSLVQANSMQLLSTVVLLFT